MDQKKLNITEIARLANVSKATVSRVINGKPNVQEKTREKIKRIIAEYDYHPSVFAKAIMHKKSNTIGLLIPKRTEIVYPNPFYDEILRGISTETIKQGYFILYCYEDCDNYLRALKERRVDGIIAMSPSYQDKEVIDKIREMNIPFIATSKVQDIDDVVCVDVDNYSGAKMAVDHLISLGHRKIAFINGPQELLSSSERLRGYRAALKENGIEDNNYLIRSGNTSIASGRAAMESLLNTQDITAVFVASDYMALGVMSSIFEQGLKIPDDISLVGFDNIPLSEVTTPPMTTVNQFVFDKGTMVIRILIDKINNKTVNNIATIKPELILRNSTRKI